MRPATKVVVEKKLHHVVFVEKGGELNTGEPSSGECVEGEPVILYIAVIISSPPQLVSVILKSSDVSSEDYYQRTIILNPFKMSLKHNKFCRISSLLLISLFVLLPVITCEAKEGV